MAETTFETRDDIGTKLREKGWTFEHPGYWVKELDNGWQIGVSDETVCLYAPTDELGMEASYSWTLEEFKVESVPLEVQADTLECIRYLKFPLEIYWGDIWANPDGTRIQHANDYKCRIDIDMKWFGDGEDEEHHRKLRELTNMVAKYLKENMAK